MAQISNAVAAVILESFVSAPNSGLTQLPHGGYTAVYGNSLICVNASCSEVIVYQGDDVVNVTTAAEMIGATQAWGMGGIASAEMFFHVARRGDWTSASAEGEVVGGVSKVILGGATFHVEGGELVSAGRFSQAQVQVELAGDFDRVSVDGRLFSEVDGQVGLSGVNFNIDVTESGVLAWDGITESYMGEYSHGDFLAMSAGLSSADIREVIQFVNGGLSIDKARAEAQTVTGETIDVILGSYHKADLAPVYTPSADLILSSHKAEELPVYASKEDLEFVAAKVELVGKSDFVEFVKFEG